MTPAESSPPSLPQPQKQAVICPVATTPHFTATGVSIRSSKARHTGNQRQSNTRSKHAAAANWRLLLALACLWLSTGCTLLAPYDPVTDQAVTQLSIRTETALAASDAGLWSLAESRAFLAESIGTVRALKVRAMVKEKNMEVTTILDELEKRYQALLDRGKPLRTSVATGLRLTLLDLQQVQIAKKRSAASRANP